MALEAGQPSQKEKEGGREEEKERKEKEKTELSSLTWNNL